jgi:TolA-binding protein
MTCGTIGFWVFTFDTAQGGHATLDRTGLLLGFVLTLGVLGCGTDDRGKVAREFDVARKLMTSGKFDSAATKLEEFLENHPTHELAGRATFLLAKSHLGRSRFDESKKWFNRTIQRFPESEEAHKAKFKLAVIELLSGNLADAEQQFETLATQSEGPYVPEAQAFSRFLAVQRVLQNEQGEFVEPNAP